ncbi:AAA family ATPase [Amnibacterium endophyticum]|uniref:CpaE family protein n=1 Tax=Amnibacterium endophyticum TaxID=2109337 RepID=A0ABW4L909_9MICO
MTAVLPAAPAALEPPVEEPTEGRLLAVLSPKGGVGKTTLAASVAAALAADHPGGVVLVDADLQFGDVAAVLDMEPERTLPDLVAGPIGHDDLILKTLLEQHASGPFVVCGARSPEEGDRVSPEQLGALLSGLRRGFRWVVVDTTPALGEHTLAVLDRASDALAVSSLSVPGLRALRTELAVLTRIGFRPRTLTCVLNQVGPAAGLTEADAARILERRIDAVVPHSRAVAVATNRGVPVVVERPRDRASRAIARLVKHLDGAATRRTAGGSRA